MNTVRATLRRCAALATVGVALTHAGVRADEPAGLRARCAAFLQKVVTAQRKALDERLAAEIAEVAKVTELGPEGIQALRQAAVAAEDAAQADLLAKGTETLTKAYGKNGGLNADGLDRPELVEAFAQPDLGVDREFHYTHALDQPAWKDALTRTLTPAQAARWQKSLDERDGAAAKAYEVLLDRQADEIRPTVTGPMLTRSAEIIDVLGLTGERAGTVTELAKKAVDASMSAWRRAARQSFLAGDEETRAQVLHGTRNEVTMPAEEDAPLSQAVWTEGIARLLTDADHARLGAAHDEQRRRRTHALTAVSLLLMDEKVALTAAQRPPLEALMERVVERTDQFYPKAHNNADYFNLPPATFYKAAAGVNPDEVRPVLDDLQWKRWREAGASSRPAARPLDGSGFDEPKRPPKAGSDTGAPPAIEEPEDLEQLVSDYLQERVEVQHQDLNAAMLLQVEDATRVAALPPEVTARLRTAALGAAEVSLAAWMGSVEQSVRAQVQGATRESIKARISTVSRYSYGQAQSREQELWKAAVKSDLTPAQQDAWQAERDARARYAEDATAQYLLAEFDRHFALSADQSKRLAPLVLQAIHDYRPDINRLFAYHTTPWYLASYYLFLPLHAVPEAECKAIVGKERYDRWAESNNYRFSVQYWDNLRESHERRLKEEKK